ncbi:MAG: hypothetical protein L0219_08465, partial [Phycisphaerales bacterium]|nr:hypothetical protein [Phycisphaerales bacterium]
MRYVEIQPSRLLQRFVECFWILEGDDRGAAPILPDGCMELVIHYGDRFRRIHENGNSEIQPRAFVVGQMTGPIAIAPTGRAGILGVRFRPGGA